MRLADAVSTLQLKREKIRKAELLRTVWDECETEGENRIPLPEYPRPQLVRENWINLNGSWDYRIVPAGKEMGTPDGRILVPFSPETSRSGAGRVLMPGEAVWYSRQVELPEIPGGNRVLLHFEAVDERCKVWWNGTYIGSHRGGYLPFTFDVSGRIREGINELLVYVRDDSDKGTAVRGKQRLDPGGMFYQAQSGIWQTVWMEIVPDSYVEDLRIVPDVGKKEVQISLTMKVPEDVEIETEGRKYRYSGKMFWNGNHFTVRIPVQQMHLWSPEDPKLYDVTITAGEDRICSYFAMRSVGTGTDAGGHPCLTLNGEPYFFHGVLDQGYWPESLLTPPSDEALIHDISEMKRLGFNTIRKHEKIECERWYYHCDRLGMVVWQDMPHGGDRVNAYLMTYLPTLIPAVCGMLKDSFYRLFGRKNRTARRRFEKDLLGLIRHLSNHPSVCLWGIFNEGWGQFDSLRLSKLVKEKDPGRLIDHASGWFDQGGGDIRSEHNYFRKLTVKHDRRPYVLSEYGGFSCRIPGHTMYRDNYGYHDYSEADLPEAYERLMKEIAELRKEGLAAAVYTQVSDIEEETNGLLTYDRKKCKV